MKSITNSSIGWHFWLIVKNDLYESQKVHELNFRDIPYSQNEIQRANHGFGFDDSRQSLFPYKIHIKKRSILIKRNNPDFAVCKMYLDNVSS